MILVLTARQKESKSNEFISGKLRAKLVSPNASKLYSHSTFRAPPSPEGETEPKVRRPFQTQHHYVRLRIIIYSVRHQTIQWVLINNCSLIHTFACPFICSAFNQLPSNRVWDQHFHFRQFPSSMSVVMTEVWRMQCYSRRQEVALAAPGRWKNMCLKARVLCTAVIWVRFVSQGLKC